MKRHMGGWVLAGLMAAMPVAAQSVNPKAVAQLRWYPVNQSATYSLGEHVTYSIGFDGQDIWLGSGGDNVYKIRPSDGKVLANASVQDVPQAMAFDGTNMWVANSASSSVSKIRASDGKNLGNFTVGEEPVAMEFNGTNIVVIKSGPSSSFGSVVILRPSDGTILHNTTPTPGSNAAAFDGTYVWTVGPRGGLVTVDQNGAAGPVLGMPADPSNIVFDGTFMWVALSNQTVVKVARNGTSANALSIVGTYAVSLPGSMAFDGEAIWVTSNGGGGGITKFRAIDGKNLGTFPSPPVAGLTYSLGFDGTNLWMACYPESNVQSVCKL